MMQLPRCECGGEQTVEVVYTGADWLTVAGEGSGFDYEIHLVCKWCGGIYHIGNVKKETDFAFTI